MGFRIYTDSSSTVGRGKVCKADWAFVVYGLGPEHLGDTRLLKRGCGPVVVDSRSQYFIGAGRKTNNA